MDNKDKQPPEQNMMGSVNSFPRGMNKDSDPRFLQQGQYISAINATLNSHQGDLYKIGNEPSTTQCAKIPYQVVGSTRLKGEGRYAIFSTDDISSEIGVFDENLCTYTTTVNDKCLNFSTHNLIHGVSKENYDCTESIYWNDGLNPARVMNMDRVPYKQIFTKDPLGGCDIPSDSKLLDCEKIRLSPLTTVPNLSLTTGQGGDLPNGAYRVAIAYTSKEVRVSDYLNVTLPQYIFHQTVQGGSLELTVSNLDPEQDEYVVILIATVDQQTTARIQGYYSTQTTKVHIDTLKQDQKTVTLSDIPLQSPYWEGGDGMYKAGSHLIQTAPRTRPGFNYQPQASKIRAKWVAYAVPEDYYKKGGSKIGYTKGENIALAIRFVLNTGHRTDAFPLVGREANSDEKSRVTNADAQAYGNGEPVEKWELYDTSTITKIYPDQASEHIAMEGEFGYHESSEPYPDNREVWGRLSCNPMRLMRFPDNCTVPNYDTTRKKILILGIKVEGVTVPLDSEGKVIPGVVGYEILRADKEGNKNVMAKGLIFNTGTYDLPSATNEKVKGMYANYPLNDLTTDPFLSGKQTKGGCNGKDYTAVGTFNRDIFTFHSPETSFSNPLLGGVLKVEAEYYGDVKGNFEPVYRHPKNKLIRDFAFFTAAMVGVGEGLLAVKGKTTYTNSPTYVEASAEVFGVGAKVYKPLPMISNLLTGAIDDIGSLALGNITKRATSTAKTSEETAASNIPLPLRIANVVVLFSYFFGQGTSVALEIMEKLIPYQQYAYQYNGEALLNKQVCPQPENFVRSIEDFSYLYPSFQDFQGYRVNNRYRESGVILKLGKALADPRNKDNSRQTIGTMGLWDNPTKPFRTQASAYYVSIKRKITDQYGQVDGWRLLPTHDSIIPITSSGSSIIFGGDTIIDEFTIKRKMSYFSQTAYDVPDNYEIDYRLYPNMPYPRYWMDSHKYDISQFFNLTNIKLPDDSHYLDRRGIDCKTKISFVVSKAYFYLHNSAVSRFYVESSYNLPYRQNSSTDDTKKHFDKFFFTDLSTLFRTDVIHFDNTYSIDRSLSPIKQIDLQYGQVQPRDFSLQNEKCFAYEPNRLIYSLPSNLESKRDTWRNFLTNNIYVFPKASGKLISIKEVSRTGILYLFQDSAAKLHSGIDELQTVGGIKVTLGDGGLFAQEPQNITNTDFDLSECQSAYSAISTQYGIFFISQRQGKILQYIGYINDISFGIKWWLSEYLPSRLLRDFPNFELSDNPVAGVGCQAVFDNANEIIYFTKKDYELKPEFSSRTTYLSGVTFKLDGRRTFTLGDPRYFNDASWTLSYDPKMRAWVSFHDWHPDWLIQGKKHFHSFKGKHIWSHNEATESFCNFYGVDYPWEVEMSYANPQQTTTLESVEYQLESFKYIGKDRHHLWDYNFDRAIIYNSEQCSGMLKLNAREFNRPLVILQYPNSDGSSFSIEYTKQEQKYRFNQFHDLTRDRAQQTLNIRTIFLTDPNGYTKHLNPNNLNYDKPVGQRKKIRHNATSIILRRNISADVKMLLLMFDEKQLKSFR